MRVTLTYLLRFPVDSDSMNWFLFVTDKVMMTEPKGSTERHSGEEDKLNRLIDKITFITHNTETVTLTAGEYQYKVEPDQIFVVMWLWNSNSLVRFPHKRYIIHMKLSTYVWPSYKHHPPSFVDLVAISVCLCHYVDVPLIFTTTRGCHLKNVERLTCL